MMMESETHVDLHKIEIVSSYSSDDLAAVKIVVDGRTVEGTAKRDPADRPNHTIGTTLATGRALRKMGNQMIREAEAMVAQADKERRREAARRAQARSEQRKAENAARKAADDKERLVILEDEVERLAHARATLASRIAERDAVIAEHERKDQERKQRAYKKRIATRQARAKAGTKA